MLLALTLFGGCGRLDDFELVQKFQAAQQAFDDARKPEEFAKVAMLDQEILDRWGLSGAGALQSGQCVDAGRASRAAPWPSYRLAQRYLPRDPFLDANLRLGVGLARPGSASPGDRNHPLLAELAELSREVVLWRAAVALATFAVAVVWLFAARRWLRRIAWVGLALDGRDGVFGGLRLAAIRQHAAWRGDSVRRSIARKGNGASYEPAFKEPLAEATEFRLVERRGDWLLVRLPGGGEGWIEQKAAVTY